MVQVINNLSLLRSMEPVQSQSTENLFTVGIPYPLQLGLLSCGLLHADFDLPQISANKLLGVELRW